MQEKKEIPSIVNEKIVMLKFSHIGRGYLPFNGSGEQQMDRSEWILRFISSLTDKVSFNTNSMSSGIVLLEKLFMRTQTPQGDSM